MHMKSQCAHGMLLLLGTGAASSGPSDPPRLHMRSARMRAVKAEVKPTAGYKAVLACPLQAGVGNLHYNGWSSAEV